MVDLDTLVQEKLEADADFQSEIADLQDEERNTKIADKRKEILSSEFERLAKADELAKNYKARAEKAEAEAKKPKHGEQHTTPKNDADLSSKDLFALFEAKVHRDDIDEVVEYARFKGISVADALKASVVKTTLETNTEQRKIAEATNTGQNRSGTKNVSDTDLIKSAASGNIPNAGSDEAERLFWARRGGKK